MLVACVGEAARDLKKKKELAEKRFEISEKKPYCNRKQCAFCCYGLKCGTRGECQTAKWGGLVFMGLLVLVPLLGIGYVLWVADRREKGIMN